MPYDAAAQYQAMLAELQAARKVAEAAARFWEAFGDECGGRLCDDLAHALNAYDNTPKAVLDYQPDQQPTRRT